MIFPNIRKIQDALYERYKDFSHHNKKNALNELLFIICSAKTYEKNYISAYKNLKFKFKTFKNISNASEREIETTIRFSGLSIKKSQQIKAIFSQITRDFTRPTLSPLEKWSNEECERYLTALPGIGIKSARCIMMYSLGRNVFPVDTHCLRIGKRLGWVPKKWENGALRKKDADFIQERIPPDLRFSLHVNFVSLGRSICRSQQKKCEICPIEPWCPKIS